METSASNLLVAPHDLDAERAVIGAMLVSEAAVGVVAEILKGSDFHSDNHRIIFRSITKLAATGCPVDPVTLVEALGATGELERIGGRNYIQRTWESVPTAANADRYARIVRDKAMLRRLLDAGGRINQIALDNPDDASKAIDRAEGVLFEVSDEGAAQVSELSALSDIAHDGLDHLQNLYERGEEVVGVPTGLYDVDRMTTGMHPGELTVLAARPAMGKSAYAISCMLHAARTSGAVALFSLEMSKEQLWQRIQSQDAGLPLSSLRTGRMSAEDMAQAAHSAQRLAQLPLYIDDSAGITTASMRSKLRRLTARLRGRGEALGLVVVDYLQLMTPSVRNESRVSEVSEISRSLKVLARDLGVPVLALAQLSRACEQRNDKRPMLSDLRDSGAIEQDADVVEFLYRDEYYNPETEDRGVAEVIIGKSRNGPTGKVSLAWIASYARFASLAPDMIGRSA